MSALSRVEIFIEVARLQSFAGAARTLGMTGPAVSKQIATLEDELGVKLLHRTTRLVTLTDEGATYYERARHAIDELKEAAAHLQDLKASPKGSLRISAPLSFAQTHLLPTLSGFAKQFPDIQMDISLDDRRVDVIADGFDIAIRIGALEDSSLVSRKLADCPIFFVASPAYVATHGMPKKPGDLKQHRMITYSYQGTLNEWRYACTDGTKGSVRFDSAMRANTAEMMTQAAVDGIGITLLPVFCVATLLKAGQLVRVLPEYESDPRREIAALMPPNRYRTAKVRLLLDWLAAAMKTMHLEA